MRSSPFFIGFGAVLLAATVSAEELRPSPKETSLLAGLGVDAGPSVTGLGVTLAGTHRLHWLEVGVEGRATGPLPLALSAGGVMGLHVGRRLSLRILGASGARYYDRVGRSLLSEDPGVSGATPYVGARVLVGWSFERLTDRNHAGYLALMGVRDYDLERKTRSVTYTEYGWLFGTSSEVTRTHTIGQTSLGVFVVGGVDFDLTGY